MLTGLQMPPSGQWRSFRAHAGRRATSANARATNDKHQEAGGLRRREERREKQIHQALARAKIQEAKGTTQANGNGKQPPALALGGQGRGILSIDIFTTLHHVVALHKMRYMTTNVSKF
jgi:hypothetical protein